MQINNCKTWSVYLILDDNVAEMVEFVLNLYSLWRERKEMMERKKYYKKEGKLINWERCQNFKQRENTRVKVGQNCSL